MAGGISVHVVDVTRGLPAAGMKVEIFQLGVPAPIASGILSSQGTLDHPIAHGKAQGEKVEPGIYKAVFHVGAFYRQLGYPLPDRPFLDVVPFRFGIDAIEQHYHLPLKVSPWGFSLFRGG
ncbi:hydroxyisourate hydrolase [Leptolyngbya sp. FACHB-711]|uniref:hydroxyisourate hydrolase n=1 Tax=unclassified Leptolyngbya TaxID=2650499 RepID=UPI001683258C|nr:hydroxyisourate hydrolase [Leptolyngbya sp. FACHB-711]MBD1852602.1 hydroxyisourate hydrolase [Cyanobacteria bacterium FACHB-502]MBD2025774.1 hydroxyisourate hydrolase [Leptolyngbya sp. FACHB-711]